jgi:LysM repeat protein
MARMKRGMLIASMLMLVSIVLSACNQPYSQAPAVTNTPIPQSNLFASAQPTTMGDVSVFATGSAVAQLTTSPGAPAAATATLMPGVTPLAVTATNTPIVAINPTATATLAVPAGPSSTAVPVGARTDYVLKPGEFPYCIARRYNVDPDDMLRLSGLSDGVLYDPGTVLKIPQSGTFPGNRMLRNHPGTYTVSQTGETVYSVACAYGDVDPNAIATTNGISVDANLTAGQTLNIP